MFDFGLGATELMLIAVVALIVVGPKDLPRLMRWVGNAVAKVRAMAREFQGHLDEAMRESGLDEVRKSVSEAKEYTVADLDAEFEKLEREFRETALPDSPTDDATASKAKAGGGSNEHDVVDLDEDLLDETERPVLSLDGNAPAPETGGSEAGKDEAARRTARERGHAQTLADGRAAAGQGADESPRRADVTDTGGKTT